MNIRSVVRWRAHDAAIVIGVAAIFILAVVYSVYSATVVDSNITTGTVSASNHLYASSTVQATGNGLFYANLSAGASTNTPTTTFNVTGSGYLTGGLGVGFATTGAGQLHVTGASVFESDATFNGRVVSTNSGVSSFAGTLGVASTTPTTTVGVVGSGYFTGGLGIGFATTGAGQIHNTGLTVHESRLGINGTSSPYRELGVNGNAALVSGATTTLSVESTTATAGGCIELREGVPAGGVARWVRIYVGGFGATNTLASAAPAVVGAGGAGFLVIENGRCQ